MIKIDKNDSIVDILTKISKTKEQDIVLQFPFGHPVLHNYLSLKIIQTKVKKKKLLILTNDKTSKKIGKLLHIKYGKNKQEFNKKSNSSSSNFIKKNYSFFEYTLYEIKTFFGLIKGNIQVNKTINSINYSRNRHKFLHKNIFLLLISTSIIILLLLIYIFYFAINKTYIEITPEINIKVKSRNFTYIDTNTTMITDEIIKKNEVPLEKINTKITLNNTFSSSGIKQKNNNIAKGKVTLYNLFPEKVSILKYTSFQTKQGILFQNLTDIIIPASTKSNDGTIMPGTTTEILYSKIKLLNGKYSGKKANIKSNILLTIPKLGKDKSKIFAKTLTDFNGGSNDFIKVITQTDIDSAKNSIKNILEQTAIKQIKSIIKEKNKKNNVQLEILPVNQIYKFTNLTITIPEHIKEGINQESFKIYGSINISSYAYNTEIVRAKLKKIITDSNILTTEKIDSINSKSLRISHIIKRNDLIKKNGKYTYLQELEEPIRIKATTEIEYYVLKNFENKNSYFSHKLKNSIAGMNIKEAEKLLSNQTQINNVSIKVQPFFLKTVSKIPENIIIQIVD